MAHSFLGRTVGALALIVFVLTPAHSQDGMNFHVLGNRGDVLYLGSGGGGSSTPGVDAVGYWMAGEDLQGATFSGLDVGGIPQFGYQQTGLRISVCIANNPVRIDLPGIVAMEYGDTDLGNGFSFHNPFSFLRPGCDDPNDGVPLHPLLSANRDIVKSSALGMDPGIPPGATEAWILSGAQSGLPPGAVFFGPNSGLLPSAGPAASGGTQSLLYVTALEMPISATGCYAVDLDWTVTLGSSVPALDNVQGWWTVLTASRDNNQYWSYSRDHLNLVNSIGAQTEDAGTTVFTGLATVDLEAYSFSADPVTSVALAPMNYSGSGVYYANPEGQLQSGTEPLNPGFDLGIAPAVSARGIYGVQSPLTLGPPGFFNVQDPANAGLVIGPNPTSTGLTNTVGFVTWNNNPYVGGSGGTRLTWVQVDYDLTANRNSVSTITHPSQMGDVTFPVFPGVRVPVRVPVNNVGGWPQTVTVKLFDDLIHETFDRTGDPLWPDPSGMPAGAMGIAPIVGTSTHLPIVTLRGACALGGLPVGIMYGTTGLQSKKEGGVSLQWNPAINRVSVGRAVLLYD